MGSESRFPGAGQGGNQGSRDTASGDLGNDQDGGRGGAAGAGSAAGTSASGGSYAGGGDYSLDTLPDAGAAGTGAQTAHGGTGGQPTQSGGTAAGGGAITAAERAAILDERLRRGYETFDGFILNERERAQTESNAAGSVAIGGDGTGDAGDGTGGAQLPQTIEPPGSPRSAGEIAAAGGPSAADQQEQQTFEPPDDIPSGRDDDVVARQIREAAMTEPDPELREALWEEYRIYTGIGEKR